MKKRETRWCFRVTMISHQPISFCSLCIRIYKMLLSYSSFFSSLIHGVQLQGVPKLLGLGLLHLCLTLLPTPNSHWPFCIGHYTAIHILLKRKKFISENINMDFAVHGSPSLMAFIIYRLQIGYTTTCPLPTKKMKLISGLTQTASNYFGWAWKIIPIYHHWHKWGNHGVPWCLLWTQSTTILSKNPWPLYKFKTS